MVGLGTTYDGSPRDPGCHEGVHSHAIFADLQLGTLGMLTYEIGKKLQVRDRGTLII